MINNNNPKNEKNHSHPLYYTERNQGYQCKGECNEHFSPNSFSYYCNICDFDICPNCYKNTNPNYNTTFHSSNHKHPLKFLKREKYYCDGVCKRHFFSGAYSYYCSICDIDLCPTCFNFIANNCGPQNNVYVDNHPHPLKFVPRRGFNCDICKKGYNDSFSYFCSICDFDVCEFCYKLLINLSK